MLPMELGDRGSRVPGKLTPVNDLRLDGVSPYRFPAFDGLGRATLWRGPDQYHFVVAAALAGGRSVFKERPLRFRIVGERRLPPPAVMNFRYRKALAREIFSCAARRFVAINIFVKSKQIYF